MDEGATSYDYVLEYDGVSWKIIGKMSVARYAHAVSVVNYDSVCPAGWNLLDKDSIFLLIRFVIHDNWDFNND